MRLAMPLPRLGPELNLRALGGEAAPAEPFLVRVEAHAMGRGGRDAEAVVPVLEKMGSALVLPAQVTGALALLGAGCGLYYMYRCYRIKARPFWDHKQTGFSFVGCSLYLGAICLGVVGGGSMAAGGESPLRLLSLCSVIMGLGLALEGVGLSLHARDMSDSDSEGAVSHYVQKTTFGNTWLARNTLLAVTAVSLLCGPLYLGYSHGPVLWSMLVIAALLIATVGRALFYVLVIPTTMPGAFFWKNKGFEQHARDIGLAEMPQVGVVPLQH